VQPGLRAICQFTLAVEINSQDPRMATKRASRLHALLHDVRLTRESIDRTRFS
jgi:hypothetical protein